jgi:hypothetical protein
MLAALVMRIIPEPKQKEKVSPVQFAHINYSLIATPSLGIIEAEKEMEAMARRVLKNSARIHDIIVEKRGIDTAYTKIEHSEEMIDEYRKMITEFLLTLSQQTLSHEEAVRLEITLHGASPTSNNMCRTTFSIPPASTQTERRKTCSVSISQAKPCSVWQMKSRIFETTNPSPPC